MNLINGANLLTFIATLILAFFFGKERGARKVIYMLLAACISTLLFHQFWSGLFSKAWTVWSTPMPSPTESNLSLAIMLTDLRNEVVSQSNFMTAAFLMVAFVAIMKRMVDGFLFSLITIGGAIMMIEALCFGSPLYALLVIFVGLLFTILAGVRSRKPKLS